MPDLLTRLALDHGPLPPTRVHGSPNGEHHFYRWPQVVAEPIGKGRASLFGIVTRWPFGAESQGYVVGPGSEVHDGEADGVYVVKDDREIATLPVAWAEAALALMASKAKVNGEDKREPLAERVLVSAGDRHGYLRDKARFIYGQSGLTGPDLFAIIWRIYLRDCEPYKPPKVPRDEVERAIGNPEQFERDEDDAEDAHLDERVPLSFDPIDEAIAALDLLRPDEYLIERYVVDNGLNIIAGHPKTMKSLALLQAGAAWSAGERFLGLASHGAGKRVFVYVTKEGSRYETVRRLKRIRLLYPDADIRVSYLHDVSFNAQSMRDMKGQLDDVFADGDAKVWLAMNPVRDFFPEGEDFDENSAKDIAKAKRWCRRLLGRYEALTVTLVHHLRKSAEGHTGLEMSGSGALYGAVDSTIIWALTKGRVEGTVDQATGTLAQISGVIGGTVSVETRGGEQFALDWYWDAINEFVRNGKAKEVAPLDVLRNAGADGVVMADIVIATGMSRSTIQRVLDAHPDVVSFVEKVGKTSRVRYGIKGLLVMP